MLTRLVQMPRARSLAPFVKMSYVAPSNCSWCDDEGRRHTVTQVEGGEQGDPSCFCFFPSESREHWRMLLMSCDQTNRLVRSWTIDRGHTPSRRKNEGVERVGNRARPRCRVGSGRLAAQRITVLGTPIGSVDFTTEKVERRLAEERLLWESIPAVPDLQCAWQILLQSANPRGNHTIRTLPPARAEGYAHAHDEGIWSTARRILADLPGSEAERDRAR